MKIKRISVANKLSNISTHNTDTGHHTSGGGGGCNITSDQ